MKSFILLFILISTSAFAQDQTKTILTLPKDTSKINLHLERAKQLNTSAHLFFAAGTLSTIVLYAIDKKSPLMFIVPVSFGLTGMGLHIWSTKLEYKYSKESVIE
jgi:hypothetical protein